MARYHNETELKPDEREKANRTLSREFWRGQLHGNGLGKSPIHARHMRSRCSSIPLGRVYRNSALLALLMLYLDTQSSFMAQKPLKHADSNGTHFDVPKEHVSTSSPKLQTRQFAVFVGSLCPIRLVNYQWTLD